MIDLEYKIEHRPMTGKNEESKPRNETWKSSTFLELDLLSDHLLGQVASGIERIAGRNSFRKGSTPQLEKSQPRSSLFPTIGSDIFESDLVYVHIVNIYTLSLRICSVCG